MKLKLKAEEDGRMFPVTDSCQTIIGCLMKKANKYGVEIMMNAVVKSVVYKENHFEVNLSGSRLLTPDYICIACGGYPKSYMFNWLKELGHTIDEPVPSLFTFNIPGNRITELMGVSVQKTIVKITVTKLEEEGSLLITH